MFKHIFSYITLAILVSTSPQPGVSNLSSRLGMADCPTITVSCPDTNEAGKPVTFTANVNGGDASVTPTFNWTVHGGTITSGQGTASITVEKSEDKNEGFVASVEVKGFNAECVNTASCAVNVCRLMRPTP
ncbi:MAG: hypothetical protein WKF74_08885 [Pyrinomonadaceae bacterium]